MASPFNPFGGRGQRGAANPAATASRGRGTQAARGSPFPPRGSSAPRGKYNVSRGRGLPQSRGSVRGRGRGAGTSNPALSHTGSAVQPPQQATNSPFGQLKQQQPGSNTFGVPSPQGTSPFTGTQNAPASQKTSYAPKFAQKQITANPAGGGLGHVPVENPSILAQYHERYDQLKVDRANKRQRAIKDGQMADPNQPTSLNKAITPVGTCTSMCPEFERVERIVQKMVDKSEKFLHPSSNVLQNMETKMLKRFRRSAAGYDEQLPSDIRTPNALLQSTNYLIRHIIGGNEPLGIIHKFVWDRTRSIRNDFSVQQVSQEKDVQIAVTCLERIARFHIVSLHLLSSPENEEPFDRHQEREQLNNTMLSLMYYYDDHRGRIHFPNEDEFRAYYIIFSIHDQRPDLEARVSKWPTSLLTSPRVQVALELYAASCNTWEYQGTLDARRPNAIAQGFYTRFFNIINSPSVSYLMACIAEVYFSYVRQTAIRAIWKGYCKTPLSQQHKNQEWSVEDLTRVLHFDDDEETIKFCEEQDLQVAENANGELYLDWGTRPVDSIGFSPSSEHAYSELTVESKRGGRSLVAVILGMTIPEAARMGMLDQFKLQERAKPSPPHETDNSTPFLSEDGSTTPALMPDPNFSTLESDFLTESSARSTPNPFQNSLPDANQPSATQIAVPPPQPLNPFQTSKLNPFASPFPSGNAMNIAPATSSSSFNPFGAASNPVTPASAPSNAPVQSPSPFSFSKPTEGEKPVPPSSPFSFGKPAEEKSVLGSKPTQSPSPFVNSGLSNPTSEPSNTPNPFAASLSSFKASQPLNSTPQATFPPPQTTQSTSLFSASKSTFPSTEFDGASAAEVPASKPAPVFGAPDSTLAGTGDAGTTAALNPKPAPFSFANPTQSSQSPFKPPSSSESPFNSPLSASEPQPQQSSSPATPAVDVTEKPKSFFDNTNGFHQLGQSFAQKPLSESPFSEQKENTESLPKATPPIQPSEKPLSASSLFGPAPTTSQPSNPMFPTPKSTEPAEKETESPASTKSLLPQSTNFQSAFSPKQSTNDPPVEDYLQRQKPAAPAAATESNSPRFNKSVASMDSSLSSGESPNPSIKRKFEDGPPVLAASEEEQSAWNGILQRLAEKQARKKARKLEEEQKLERELEQEEKRKHEENRKRALEDQAAGELPGGRESKALKVSDLAGDPAPSNGYSLFQASTRTLPTLPCLRSDNELTERTGPTVAEIEAAGKARRQREIDQDELLLSAARIAAEQLKNGPKIFDSYRPSSFENTTDHHNSYNPHRSFSASTSYSQSMSPPPPPVYPNHGYQVAYAPDTPLGLGRTLSRSEQRIRRTGAHGLAYLPLDLDFSRTRVHRKTADEKDKFSRSG
ncbi:hypothetical protein N7490_003671 [Penicillium lividum]|nr:hypothetical protein N7490_003671 [Penicillium lividum]